MLNSELFKLILFYVKIVLSRMGFFTHCRIDFLSRITFFLRNVKKKLRVAITYLPGLEETFYQQTHCLNRSEL